MILDPAQGKEQDPDVDQDADAPAGAENIQAGEGEQRIQTAGHGESHDQGESEGGVRHRPGRARREASKGDDEQAEQAGDADGPKVAGEEITHHPGLIEITVSKAGGPGQVVLNRRNQPVDGFEGVNEGTLIVADQRGVFPGVEIAQRIVQVGEKGHPDQGKEEADQRPKARPRGAADEGEAQGGSGEQPGKEAEVGVAHAQPRAQETAQPQPAPAAGGGDRTELGRVAAKQHQGREGEGLVEAQGDRPADVVIAECKQHRAGERPLVTPAEMPGAEIEGEGVEQAQERGDQLDRGEDARDPGNLPGEKKDHAVGGGVGRPVGVERRTQPVQVQEPGEGLQRLLRRQFDPGKYFQRIAEDILGLLPIGPGPALVQEGQEAQDAESEQEGDDLVLAGRGQAQTHF